MPLYAGPNSVICLCTLDQCDAKSQILQFTCFDLILSARLTETPYLETKTS